MKIALRGSFVNVTVLSIFSSSCRDKYYYKVVCAKYTNVATVQSGQVGFSCDF